jgi:hypothetical protein
MYAERMIVESDQFGSLKALPKLPANKQLEAIFLIVSSGNESHCRQPHRDVAGKMRLVGDVVNCVPASDWDLA